MKKALILPLFFTLVGCADAECSVAQIVPSVTVPDSVTVIFSGDFMQHSPQVTAAHTNGTYDYDTQLRYISPYWKSADFAVINLETTLTDDGQYSGYPMFASPVEIAQALARAGITHVALANNHALDRRGDGVRKTAAALDFAGLPHTGVYATDSASKVTLMLEKDDFRIAVINFTYGTNGMAIPRGMVVNTPLDTAAMGAAIDRAHRAGATHTIVYVHFGQEYQITPDTEQKWLALWLRSRGANLVIGSHPHVPQPIDRVHHIVYSLGNFVSNQRKRYTDGGYSVRVTFSRHNFRPTIDFMPHYVDLSGSGGERYRILTPADSTIIADPEQRRRMINSINDTRTIINSKVDYGKR